MFASPWEGLTIRGYIEMTQARQFNMDNQQRYFFWAAGFQPPEYMEELQRQQRKQSAEQFPVIPAWLGENLPLQVVFVPNGEILTYGPLGLHFSFDESDPQSRWQAQSPAGETWYRYDREGKLLGEHKLPGHGWMSDWGAIFTDWNALQKQYDPDSKGISIYHLQNGGRVFLEMFRPEVTAGADPIVVNHSDMQPKILAAFDYLGQPIDVDQPYNTRDFIGQTMYRDWLKSIYETQVELGLTDPSLKSPWAGTPEGPVSVDPTPRPLRRWAVLNHSQEQEVRVEIRPLNDPANPYLDKYEGVDYWLESQYGKRNPLREAYYEEQRKKREAEREAEIKEGKPVSMSYVTSYGYIPGPDDHWEDFQVFVDEDGWVIPQHQIWQETHERWLNHDYRKGWQQHGVQRPSFSSGGVPSPELKAAIDAKRAEVAPQPTPHIPAWLADMRAHYVTFVPNGDVVVYGSPGSWREDWRNVPDQERWAGHEKAYFRYSADGALLGKCPVDENGWSRLYNPQYDTLVLNGKSQGYEVDRSGSFLIWRKPQDQGGEVVAAWDYDGTPLDISQPLKRAPGELHSYSWGQLVEIMQKQGVGVSSGGAN